MNRFNNINYLYKPSESANAPTIILIHGYGSNEKDLFSFSEDLKQFNIISLQGVRNTPMGGYSWYDLNLIDGKMASDQEQAIEVVQLLSEFIKNIKNEHSIVNEDLWLCGFSQGAILSYALMVNYPNLVNKVICLSGYPDTRLWENKFENQSYKHLKVFVSHGFNDMVLPVEWAQNSKELLSEKQIQYAYKEYQSGHGLNPQNYADLINWIHQNV